jgi:dephospho-CoA kinase
MLEIGLTGCRYSGKSSVSKLFRKIGVPVFDADTVLKFILNFRTYVDEPIKSNVGSFVYTAGFLDPTAFVTDSIFDRTVDVVEFELFQSWETFKMKHKDKPYIIFESSILFERKWENKFNKIISVFAPKEERVYRAKMETDMRVDYIWSSLDKEIPDLEKNSNSHYIIHNYENGPDILKQINHIDTKLIDMYIENDKGIKRKQLKKSVSIFEKDEDKIVNSLFDQNLKFLMK